jgi:hypothetical protein
MKYLLRRLTKRDPETVQVADDEFAHAVEGVVRGLDYDDSVLQALK